MKKGIDISKWQGSVDFSKVKNEVDFVILREGYRKQIDPKFLEYVKGCSENGIPVVGVYHFCYATSAAGAIEEAKSCLTNIEKAGLAKKDIVVFFDFEYDSVKKAAEAGVTLGKAECIAFTKAFCNHVESQGYTAGVYSNLDYYKNMYDKETLAKYVYWLADYTGDPDVACTYHQYTSSGKVSGISGNVDMNYYYGAEKKEEAKMGKTRAAVVDLVNSWIGKKESDGSYKTIIDIYNGYKGTFPRNTKMQYGWAWCACTWSALAIKLGYTDIMPIEISCGYLIEAAKKMGIWVEKDFYVAQPGDAVLYDWDDTGSGDCTGWPDHVGTIVETNESAGYFVVVEGNYGNAVKKRTLSINGRYIRGFICPKYDAAGTSQKPAQSTTSKKSVTTIAREVIAGSWGNGDARKAALEKAGYNYSEVQKKVNEILNGSASSSTTTVATSGTKKSVKASDYAQKGPVSSLAGTYKVTAKDGLYMRHGAGTNKKAMVTIPYGTKVECYGYYSVSGSVKWLYIQVTLNGVTYTGFSSSTYLKK